MSGRDRRLLAIAGLVLLGVAVAAAGFLLVVRPQRSQAGSLDAQLAAARAELASLRSGGGSAPAIHAADLFRLARAMPASDDMAGIVLDLSRLARASSLSLVSVKPSPRVALSDGSSALPLSVTLQGRWSGLSAFLARLRRQVALDHGALSVAGRVYDVDAIQVQAGQGKSELAAVLTMNAFDYGAPPPAGATAGVTGAGATTSTSTSTTATTATTPPPQAAGASGSGS